MRLKSGLLFLDCCVFSYEFNATLYMCRSDHMPLHTSFSEILMMSLVTVIKVKHTHTLTTLIGTAVYLLNQAIIQSANHVVAVQSKNQ